MPHCIAMLRVGGYAFQVTMKNLPGIKIRCTQLLQRIHSVCEFFSLAGFGHLALKEITGTNCTTRPCVTMAMFQCTSKVALAHESILVNIGLDCTYNFCYCLFCFAFTKGGTCMLKLSMCVEIINFIKNKNAILLDSGDQAAVRKLI